VNISNEHNDFLNNLADWEQLKEKGGSIVDRIEIMESKKTLDSVLTSKEDPTFYIRSNPIFDFYYCLIQLIEYYIKILFKITIFR